MVCAYGRQSERAIEEKHRYYDELASEWDLRSPGEMVLGLRDFNGHVGKHIDGFENVCCLSFVMKKNCAWQIPGIENKRRRK